MIALRQHNHHDYASLPNIDASDVGTLTESDHDCLNELGDYLVKAEAHNRFGAFLLHSHFPIESNEIFFEEVDNDAELVTLRPKRAISSDATATSFCFEDVESRDGGIRLVGLEFASRQVLDGISPIGETDRDVLYDFAEILSRHGKSRRFGGRLLHDPLDLGDRVLLETCDPIERMLTCGVRNAGDPDFLESIPTTFRWQLAAEANANDRIVSQSCVQFCKSVKGCVRLPDGGHQGASSHDPVHGKGPQ